MMNFSRKIRALRILLAAGAIFLFTAPLAATLAAPPAAQAAANFSVSPQILDLKAVPRDILKNSVVLKNSTSQTLNLFLDVADINPSTGQEQTVEPTKADLTGSLASWILFPRILQLNAGESQSQELKIEVNLRAKPDTYHAAILIYQGADRAEAQTRGPAATVQINLEVRDDGKENLQLAQFTSDKKIFIKPPASFTVAVNNIGNRPSIPQGSIIIYNSRGEEVVESAINEQGPVISPGQELKFQTSWLGRFRFGKYKGLLRLDYGAGQPGTLQDTIFFWIIPWQILLVAVLILVLLVLALVWNFYRLQLRAHQAHLQTLHDNDNQ